MNGSVLSVSELNNLIIESIKGNFTNILKVSGEVANYKTSSGNLFMTLRDDKSSLSVVCWGFSKKGITIANGDNVIVKCYIQFYGKSGNLNAVATDIKKIDKVVTSSAIAKYETNKEVYQGLGYFDRKRSLPILPKRIGIVTSFDGAALQDILYVLRNSGFRGKVVVKGCTVQGGTCHKSISEAIDTLSVWKDEENNELDLIMVTRGGGSFEDLAGFSDPLVLESLHCTDKISISAVGHEIDFMLSDFVADIRAPTPSVGAEMICTKQQNTINTIDYKLLDTLQNILETELNDYRSRLERMTNIIKSPADYIRNIDNTCKELYNILTSDLENDLKIRQYKLKELSGKIENCNFMHILEKGYVLVVSDNDEVISTVDQYDKIDKQKLKLIFADGDRSIS